VKIVYELRLDSNINQAGTIAAGEKTVAEDAEIEILKCMLHDTHVVVELKEETIADRDAKIEILERIVHDTNMVVKCKTEVAEKLAAALEDLQTKAMNEVVAEPTARRRRSWKDWRTGGRS